MKKRFLSVLLSLVMLLSGVAVTKTPVLAAEVEVQKIAFTFDEGLQGVSVDDFSFATWMDGVPNIEYNSEYNMMQINAQYNVTGGDTASLKLALPKDAVSLSKYGDADMLRFSVYISKDEPADDTMVFRCVQSGAGWKDNWEPVGNWNRVSALGGAYWKYTFDFSISNAKPVGDMFLVIPQFQKLVSTKPILVDDIVFYSMETVTPVASVSIPEALALTVGGSATLTAAVLPEDATNSVVTWASDNESVATVTADGLVEALAVGTATITAAATDGSGKSDTCLVTVGDAAVPVTGVTLAPAEKTLIIGNTTTLIATVAPSGAGNKAVTWESNNTGVATVIDGVVTAVSVGTATITVTTDDGGKTATCAITVEPMPKVLRVEYAAGLSPAATIHDAAVGKSYKNLYNGMVTEIEAESFTIAPGRYEFTKADDSKQTIQVDNVLSMLTFNDNTTQGVTLNGVGNKAAVTKTPAVEASGGKLQVNVSLGDGGEPGNTVKLSMPSDAAYLDTYKTAERVSMQLYLPKADVTGATGLYGIYGTNGDTDFQRWDNYKMANTFPSDDDYYCITIDNDFVRQGTTPMNRATVTWFCVNFFVKDIATAGPIYVDNIMFYTPYKDPVAVTGVTLSKTENTLEEGATFALDATVAPADALNKAVTWSSDNEAVATVLGGTVRAVGAGTAKITVTTVDGGKTADCDVTVTANPLAKLAVTTGSGITPLSTVTGTAAGMTYKRLPNGSPIAISGTSVPNLLPGDYEFANGDNTKTIAVNDMRVAFRFATTAEGVEGDKGGAEEGAAWTNTNNPVVYKNGQLQLNAKFDGGGRVKIMMPTDTGSATAYDEATRLTFDVYLPKADVTGDTTLRCILSNGGQGWHELSAVVNAAGMVLEGDFYRATIDNDISGNGYKGTGYYYILPVLSNFTSNGPVYMDNIAFYTPYKAVSGVSVGTDFSMDFGTIKTLTATVTPAAASNKNVTWHSSNEAVATVDAKGVVKAIAAGTATITATSADDGTKSGSCTVTVEARKDVTSIDITQDSATLTKRGERITLSTTVLPANATNTSAVWTSSNPGVAAVSQLGVVTAISAGTASIIATAENGLSDSCAVVVTVDPIPQDIMNLKIRTSGNKFVVGADNKEIWMNGVNTAWFDWDEFGRTMTDAEWTTWDNHFADLHNAGINSSRVWFFCSGTAGPIFDADGYFTGVTEVVWTNLDKLLEIAKKNEIYIMATPLSFDNFANDNGNYKKWREMIWGDGYFTPSGNNKIYTEPTDMALINARIDSYIDNFLIPFVARYADNPYLWSIDFCNEPDWIWEEARCGNIPVTYLSNFFARSAVAVHKVSDVLVTAGLASPKYNGDKADFGSLPGLDGTGLLANAYEGNIISTATLSALVEMANKPFAYVDFNSPHFYGWEHPYWGCSFDRTVVQLMGRYDKPIVIGECSGNGEAFGSAKSITGTGVAKDGERLAANYEDTYNNGYNGIMAWTSNAKAGDQMGGITRVSAAGNHMLALIPHKVFPLTRTAPPTPTPTPTQEPMPTPEPTPDSGLTVIVPPVIVETPKPSPTAAPDVTEPSAAPTPAPTAKVTDSEGNTITPDENGTITIPDGGARIDIPGASLEIGGGATVTQTDGSILIQGDSTIQSGGATINLAGGASVINNEAGSKTEVPAERVIIIGQGGAKVTYASGITLTLDEGEMLMLDEDIPLGFAPAPTPRFADVPVAAWYSGGIAFVNAHKLFAGTGTGFSPFMPITYGMLTTVLHRAAGSPEADVQQNGAYYSAGTAWAAETGIADALGGTAAAGDTMTREQVLALVAAFAAERGMDIADAEAIAFADESAISEWARDAARWARAKGIIFGKPGNLLDPKGIATRAEVAMILQRFITLAE